MDREAVLQAVLKENWDPVITWLYKNQQAIPKDDLLGYAAGIFAAEFFAKLPSYALDQPDISTYLATLWSLHRRQLYVLEPPAHYRLLIIQSALRNSHHQPAELPHPRAHAVVAGLQSSRDAVRWHQL